MKKRRIEVTRERWTRIRIEARVPPVCPFCRGAPELVPAPVASERTGLSVEEVNRAINAGVLAAWETQGSESVVCLGCVRKLKQEKET
jgi:hypothetical protein